MVSKPANKRRLTPHTPPSDSRSNTATNLAFRTWALSLTKVHTVQREAIPTDQHYAREPHTTVKGWRKTMTAKVHSSERIGPDAKLTANLRDSARNDRLVLSSAGGTQAQSQN